MQYLIQFGLCCLFPGLLYAGGAVRGSREVEVTGTVEKYGSKELVFMAAGKNALTGELLDVPYRAPISADGSFSIRLPSDGRMEWAIENDDNMILVDLAPGAPVRLKIGSWASLSDYRGTGADSADIGFLPALLADSLYKFVYTNENYMAEIQKKDFAGILSKRRAKRDYELAFLEKYRLVHHISDDYYRWKKTEFNYTPNERLIIDLLMAGGFNPGSKLDSADYAYFCNISFDDDYAARNCVQYGDIVDMYTRIRLGNWHFSRTPFDSVYLFAKTTFRGMTRDVYLTRLMCTMYKAPNFDSVFAYYVRDVADRSLIDVVDGKRKEYLAAVEAAKKSPENISQSKDLNEIFQKYRGKVVYVDFWASWCGPCRMEMPGEERLQTKFRGKDVVFLYLAYNDKKEDWLKARKDLGIGGEHYLLSAPLMREAERLFKINGIPHYALIDRNGNIVDENAPRPSSGQELEDRLNRLQ